MVAVAVALAEDRLSADASESPMLSAIRVGALCFSVKRGIMRVSAGIRLEQPVLDRF